MLRSLFSGISGLRSHQTMLDVTGNNIANVNTTGFKSSQIQFQDTLSQVLSNAGAAQDDQGGTNPAQVGLGVRVAGVTTNFTQGASQLTGRSTDMMIQGDGFFVVRKGNETYYTRDGSFDFDATGDMVLPGDGALVQGWAAVNGVVDTAGQLSDLRVPAGTLMGAQGTASATYEGNLDASAADGSITRSIEVYDDLGTARNLNLTFTKSGADWTVTGTDDAGATSGAVALTFDPVTGALASTTPASTPASPATITVGGVTVDISSITGFSGVDTVKAQSQDGHAAGTLQSFELGQDGTITGSFSNGLKQVIGRLAMAGFTNPAGLERAGGSLFSTTVNSGVIQLGTPGTGGRGTLAGGSLEMSNVDLSSEFTNLIVAQRGFQANARVITTSDDVLEELVNLKR
ncbi:MAG TPA: flagellar hook protein FlgE [Cellulomonas sp.]